jgi:hypothetical protein
MLCVEIGNYLGHAYCTDINVFVQKSREAFLDGSAVDHEERPIMASCCHHNPGHILVASWNRDVGVMVLS